MATNSNSISLAGEFAVLSQLLLRGYDANVTLGNTKGVDILVSDSESGRMLRVEVKTRGHLKGGKPGTRSGLFGYSLEWIVSKKNETIDDPSLFYCFVSIVGDETMGFRFFILPSEVVAKYVREQHAFWLEDDSSHKDTPIRVFRIALDSEPRPISTPMAEQYEGNWSFET